MLLLCLHLRLVLLLYHLILALVLALVVLVLGQAASVQRGLQAGLHDLHASVVHLRGMGWEWKFKRRLLQNGRCHTPLHVS